MQPQIEKQTIEIKFNIRKSVWNTLAQIAILFVQNSRSVACDKHFRFVFHLSNFTIRGLENAIAFRTAKNVLAEIKMS